MTTPFDQLIAALIDAGSFMAGAEAAPEAILWCDAGGEFAPVIPALRQVLAQLLTMGEYDPSTRTGPAIWLRAAAARQVPGLDWPAGQPPIIWLPAVKREVLRGAEDCDPALQPLVWYAVAGTFFGQRHQSRDWTLRGFLAAQGSPVALDIPEDATTRMALARAATRLFAEPVTKLRGTRWDAAALDALLAPDPARDMLMWMDGTLSETSDLERFAAFAARATKELGFDPRQKSRQDAAAALAQHKAAWSNVWQRFEEAGGDYEGVVKLLLREEPPDLFTPPTAYPRENIKREVALRRDLTDLSKLDHTKAAARVGELEKDHGWRRSTVWAARGDAPLAMALEHLVHIANAAALPAHDADGLANAYVEFGWQADASALKALGCARVGQERDAVVAALRAVYLPWLDQGAKALQILAGAGGVAWPMPAKPPPPPKGAVLLFVDGLRMDLAQDLVALLRGRGVKVQLTWRWSGFPTITATCKALVSPAAGTLKAGPVADLLPATLDGKAATKPVLYKAIEATGWSTQDTLLADVPIWRECGRFDEEGHARGSRMAESVPDGLREVVETVLRLAEQGRKVRIVTDHGWLLMPGGLPQAALETGLVEPSGKRSRMAALKPGAPTSYLLLPWTWDPSVSVAVPTGARAFIGGQEYAHGGVSPQECVLPILDIGAEVVAQEVRIKATWQRLRLKVEVTGGAGLMFDLRLGSDSSGPSVLPKGSRVLDDFGHLGVLVSDEYGGKEVCLVVHPPGNPQDVLAKRVDTVEG